MTTRVFLVDDHEIVRRGLRELLKQAGLDVVGEASTAAEAMARIPAVDPDVAVLDVRLPDGTGIEVCRELLDRAPRVRCLMLTSYTDDEALLASILAGAKAYLLKQIRGTELVDVISRVAAGETLLDTQASARVSERLRGDPPVDKRVAMLTPQERRLLDLLVEGLTNREIAARMVLAEKTVKNYVSNLLAKMGMQSRTEAAVYAARLHERRNTSGRQGPAQP